MFKDVPRESPACWAPTNVNPQADRSLALHHQFVVRAKFPRKRRACDPLPPGEAYESHILSVCLRTRKGEKGKGGRRNLSRGSSGLSRSPPRLHRPRATTPLPQVSPTPIPYFASSKHGHLIWGKGYSVDVSGTSGTGIPPPFFIILRMGLSRVWGSNTGTRRPLGTDAQRHRPPALSSSWVPLMGQPTPSTARSAARLTPVTIFLSLANGSPSGCCASQRAS